MEHFSLTQAMTAFLPDVQSPVLPGKSADIYFCQSFGMRRADRLVIFCEEIQFLAHSAAHLVRLNTAPSKANDPYPHWGRQASMSIVAECAQELAYYRKHRELQNLTRDWT